MQQAPQPLDYQSVDPNKPHRRWVWPVVVCIVLVFLIAGLWGWREYRIRQMRVGIAVGLKNIGQAIAVYTSQSRTQALPRTMLTTHLIELRVMSFNIRYGTANDGLNHWIWRHERTLAAIRGFDPDFLGTQETLVMQRDYLAQQLKEYICIGVGRDDGKNAGEMTAVFYKKDRFQQLDCGHFWLSPTPDQPGSIGWDAALTRMATWVKLSDRSNPSAKPILFINTHFDNAGENARAQSILLIRAKVSELGKGCTVVLTGDFNSTEDEVPYTQLILPCNDQITLMDTYRALHPNRDPNEATFHDFNPKATKGSRIDWILASPEWETRSADIDRTLYDGHPPSDHFPVNAILHLKMIQP